MSEGYKIPIDLSALDEMIQKIDRAAEAIKGLDSGVKSINTSMKSGGRSSRSSGSTDVPGMVDTSGRTFSYDVIGGLSGSFRQQNTQRFLAAQQYQQQRQQSFDYDIPGGLSGSFRQQNTQRFIAAQKYQQQRQQSFDYDIPGGLSGSFRQQTTQRFLAAQKYQQQRQDESDYDIPGGLSVEFRKQTKKGILAAQKYQKQFQQSVAGENEPVLKARMTPEERAIQRAENAVTKRFKAPRVVSQASSSASTPAPAPTPRVASQASVPVSAPKPTPSPSISPSGSQTIAMPKPLGGPFQNLQAAQGNLQNLINQGVPPSSPAFKDAQVRIQKAQQAVQSIIDAMNPSPDQSTAYRGMSRVVSRGAISLAQAAISSSGMGGSVGLAANAGLYGAAAFGAIPTMIGAAVIGAGAAGYYGAATSAKERNLGVKLGLTSEAAGFVNSMGASGEVAGIAEKLREGSIGGAYLRRKGLRDLGEIQTDRGKNFADAIQALRDEKDEKLKKLMTRETGLSDQSAYIYADEELWRGIKQSMEEDEVPDKNIANAELNMDIAKRAINKGFTLFGGKIAKIFNDYLNPDYSPMGNKGDKEARQKAYERARAENDKKKRENLNYDPLNERVPKNEIVGGGSRAQSSVNIGQSVAAANSYGLQEQIRLGAFPVY